MCFFCRTLCGKTQFHRRHLWSKQSGTTQAVHRRSQLTPYLFVATQKMPRKTPSNNYSPALSLIILKKNHDKKSKACLESAKCFQCARCPDRQKFQGISSFTGERKKKTLWKGSKVKHSSSFWVCKQTNGFEMVHMLMLLLFLFSITISIPTHIIQGMIVLGSKVSIQHTNEIE